MTLSFTSITNNSADNALLGESHLNVQIWDAGGGLVLFGVEVHGLATMSITDIFFHDSGLLHNPQLVDADDGGGAAGTDFSLTTSSTTLRSGELYGFESTMGFSADTTVIDSTVESGEMLGIFFNLDSGATMSDLEYAIGQGFGTGGLVIGLNVQSFEDGGVESFINAEAMTAVSVPLPSAGALGLLGLVGLGCRRRR